DREIDVARLQLRRNLVDGLRRRRDLDPGVARGKGRQNLEPEQPERGRCRAHADAPALGGARASGEAFECRGFFEQTRSALDEFLALARQPNPPGAAFEHLDAEVILENLDAAGQRRLGDVECRGRLRKTALPGDFNDMVYLAQIQHFALRLSRPRTCPSIKDIGQMDAKWAAFSART